MPLQLFRAVWSGCYDRGRGAFGRDVEEIEIQDYDLPLCTYSTGKYRPVPAASACGCILFFLSPKQDILKLFTETVVGGRCKPLPHNSFALDIITSGISNSFLKNLHNLRPYAKNSLRMDRKSLCPTRPARPVVGLDMHCSCGPESGKLA